MVKCPRCESKLISYDIQSSDDDDYKFINMYLECAYCKEVFKQNYRKHDELRWLK